MLKEATEYAKALPLLGWMYVGKLEFRFETDTRQAVAKTDMFSECFDTLRKTFGASDFIDDK